MDFFQAQDHARRKSGRLVFFYLAAVVAMIVTIYAVVVFLFNPQGAQAGYDGVYPITDTDFVSRYWQPDVFLGTALVTVAIIALGSLIKIMSLRAGGGVVARSVGGVLVASNTTDPQKRRLINIVEEMAIAAGIRMPEVYVLPEAGINAFAAGYSPDDAVVAVTQGALDTLSRDELQGVVAHEFSHILNGDMRLNIRLIGLLFGILLLAVLGRIVLRTGALSNARRSRDNKGGGAAIALLGLALIIIGYLGVLFGRLIQAAVSRQREFLADASAVQFTRNPDGIAGALKKIGAAAAGSHITSAHATETSHMFFANALNKSLFGAFATHPPLAERIKAIDPSFNGDFKAVGVAASKMPAHEARGDTAGFADQGQRSARSRGSVPPPLAATPPAIPAAAAFMACMSDMTPNFDRGVSILESIPLPLREAARDPERARAVMLALLYDSGNAEAAAKQDAAVAQALATTERTVFVEAVQHVAAMPAGARLSLGDIALSSIRNLADSQVDALIEAVDDFIAADGETSLYEYALRYVIVRNLRPPGRPGREIKSLDALLPEITLLLSALAFAGASSEVAIRQAFDVGVAALGEPKLALTPQNPDDVKPAKLIKALARLDAAAPVLKQKILNALAHTVSADQVILPEEQNLLRMITAALGCPAPVMGQAVT